MKAKKTAKSVKLFGNLSKYPKWNRQIKKWKKRIRRFNWIPRIYRKRKHIGNAIYSVMYLTTRKN